MRVSELVTAAKRKGFHERDGGNHRVLNFVVEGRHTRIMLVLQHGVRDLEKHMFRKLRSQLCFNDDSQFEDFVECTFSKEQYEALLRQNGHI